VSAIRIAAAVAAVALLSLAVWRLSTGNWRRALLGLGGAIVLGAYAGSGTFPTPDGEAAIEDTANALGGWTYPFAALMAFLETSIPPVTVAFPGEFAVLLCGAIAGYGRIEVVPLIALVWVSSAAGDSVTFYLGRRLGRPFLLRRGPAFGLTEKRVERVDRWFDRWGSPAVCVGRLLPLARPFAPFLAGASRYPYGRFVAWNGLGTLLFSLLFCLLGYFFYRSYGEVVDVLGRAAFGIVAAIALAVAAAYLIRRRRRGAAARARPAEESAR
jgi:membrane protein DedA with SNARE-associated domain